MSLTTAFEPLRTRWAGLPGREKNGVRLAVLLVLAFLLWQFSVAPALATLRTADAQAKALAAQLQRMQAMQIQAQAVQKQPPLGFDEAVRALTAATQQTLGSTAQLGVANERASVTLKEASPDALAEWLVQARLNARSVPLEARLVRGDASGRTVWSGVLVMGLPAR
ncbi:MAG: type II secretion system protein M [Burkholderiales bacterium]|nr:type II secretion system protein M [Burkholderiales bacterium]